MLKSLPWIITLTGAMLVACSQRKLKRIEIDDKRDGFGYGNKPQKPDLSPYEGVDQQASLALALNAVGIKLPELQDGFARYRLVYFITPVYETSGSVRFIGGRANLLLAGLPAGRQGDIRIELLDGTKVKAQAVLSDIELEVDQETSTTLILATPTVSSDGVGSDSAVATSTATATATATGTMTGTVTASNTSSEPTIEPQTTSSASVTTGVVSTIATSVTTSSGASSSTVMTTDPITSWDGLRFQGNQRWKLRPLD